VANKEEQEHEGCRNQINSASKGLTPESRGQEFRTRTQDAVRRVNRPAQVPSPQSPGSKPRRPGSRGFSAAVWRLEFGAS